MKIRFERDTIGGVDWAFLPDSIFSLARFTSTGKVYLVANATTPRHDVAGSFIPVTNSRFDHAETWPAFKVLAETFQSESTS